MNRVGGGRGPGVGRCARAGMASGPGRGAEDSLCSGDGRLARVCVVALPALLFLLFSPMLDFPYPANYFKGRIPSFFPPREEVNIEPIVTLVFSLLEIIKNAVLDLGLVWVIVFI